MPVAAAYLQALPLAFGYNLDGYKPPSSAPAGAAGELAPVLYGAGLVICLGLLVLWFAQRRRRP